MRPASSLRSGPGDHDRVWRGDGATGCVNRQFSVSIRYPCGVYNNIAPANRCRWCGCPIRQIGEIWSAGLIKMGKQFQTRYPAR